MTNDLISREALLEQYNLKNAVKYGNQTEEQRHNSYSTLMLYEVADMIRDAPDVDAAPVVHGRWIKKPFLLGTTNVCDKCGEYYGMPHGMFNYCPNCGAKMDREECMDA